MFSLVREEIEWEGRPLVLETGMIARQADGAVVASYGGTQVLATVVAQKKPKEGIDFFPLSIHYQERTYAAGKIPGGFFKREARPSEKETLTSRLIDRPVRPLFPKGFKNETQVICTVLAHDIENDPDIVAMIATSAALTISGIPFMGPICGARVAYKDGQYIINPTLAQLPDSELDLVVAGTEEGVLMVESQANQLSEEIMLGAVMKGFNSFEPVLNAIISLAEKAAKAPWDLTEEPAEAKEVAALIQAHSEAELRKAYQLTKKTERQEALNVARASALAAVEEKGLSLEIAGPKIKALESDILRTAVLETGQRIDGRSTTDIRNIDCRVSLLKRSHGSALFTRGETQALVVATLGTGQDEQIVDALEGESRQNFMLHYNFPPYSVGEAGRMAPPGRREIGHGKLAWRAINPLLPKKEDFPYTIRIVSEITESNGSSSMASVCGCSMAMMDAGVPIKSPCAGIAMGLIKEGDKFSVLSDILGDEDHLGDMDFKVAGTENGITALQMDIKITSITEEIMTIALNQAQAGRLHILNEMTNAITDSREEVSSNAPRITSFSIPKEKIREVIGTGGKIIRQICEETGAKVDIEDDGSICVSSTDDEAAKKAVDWIKSIVAEPEVGVIYHGKVVKIMDFGAFVNFMGARDGLVHISALTEGRVNKVNDVVNEGDMVYVECLGIDDRGKVRLSMKSIDQETGQKVANESDEGE